MPDEALETVRRHSLRPEDIIIELTEVVLLDDNPNTRKCISTATRHGFRFSMDDFGTGYSSLDYLRQLPFVELKLDQSFVRDLAEDVTSQRLSQAVSYIAKSLNLTTIAEGIETERQYELLAGQGYDVAQGYLKARPMPAPAFEDWYAGFASSQPGGLPPNISI